MTMSTKLLDATAHIQAGVKTILATLESLDRGEHDAAARVEALKQKTVDCVAELAAVHEKIARAEAALSDIKTAAAEASKGATETAEAIITGGKDEAKRLIAAANDTCKVVVDQREAAREQLEKYRLAAAEAHSEWNDLKARIATAKENFLKAASHP